MDRWLKIEIALDDLVAGLIEAVGGAEAAGDLAALEEGKTLWREVNSRLVVKWPGACFNETPFARVTQIVSDDVEGAAKILGFGLAKDKAIAGRISPLYQFKHFPDQPCIEVHWRAPFLSMSCTTLYG